MDILADRSKLPFLQEKMPSLLIREVSSCLLDLTRGILSSNNSGFRSASRGCQFRGHRRGCAPPRAVSEMSPTLPSPNAKLTSVAQWASQSGRQRFVLPLCVLLQSVHQAINHFLGGVGEFVLFVGVLAVYFLVFGGRGKRPNIFVGIVQFFGRHVAIGALLILSQITPGSVSDGTLPVSLRYGEEVSLQRSGGIGRRS